MFFNLSSLFEESPSQMANEMLSEEGTEEIISSSNEISNQESGSKNTLAFELEPIEKKRRK